MTRNESNLTELAHLQYATHYWENENRERIPDPSVEEHLRAIHRHRHMMKSQKMFFFAVGLLILGVALFTFFTRDQAHLQTFSATVHRDCAPWDGAAFTVQVPLNDGTTIDISIWQSPDIMFPRTFSFPDDTAQVGNAILIHSVGLPDPLGGHVTFEPVQAGTPVEGRFNLTSEGGRQYAGKFHAEWDEQIVMCG